MSIKHKVLDVIRAHPNLVTFGITLGIAMIMVVTIGDGIHVQHAYAGNHIIVGGGGGLGNHIMVGGSPLGHH